MTTQTILNYKKQIIAPFLSSSMILAMALLSLIYVSFHLVEISKQDDQIDRIQSEILLLENAVVKTEAGQRAFLLSNNQAFIANFERGQLEIHRILIEIEAQLNKSKNIDQDGLGLKLKPELQQIKRFIFDDLHNMEVMVKSQVSAGTSKLKAGDQPIDMHLSNAIDDKLSFTRSLLNQQKDSIHQEIEHAIKKAMWVVVTLLVVIVGILFSGYRRTIHLFELAVTSKNAADEFSHDAYHDALTKLPNRRYFEKHLTSVFLHAKRSQQSVALLYLDLDGFKRINDDFGHDTGDEALIYVTEQLKPVLRESDFLARLGGDEFAVVVQHESALSDLESLTHRIIACFDEQFLANSHLCKLGISIGVSSYPAHVDSVEALINQADSAMYQAKRTGKNRAIFS